MAAILTSAPYEQFEGLLAALAGRLATAGASEGLWEPPSWRFGSDVTCWVVLQAQLSCLCCPLPSFGFQSFARLHLYLRAGMAHAATLCFICAGDVDSAVRQWGKAVVKNGQAPSVDSLEVRTGQYSAAQLLCGGHCSGVLMELGLYGCNMECFQGRVSSTCGGDAWLMHHVANLF